LSDNKGRYFITSNRDESSNRQALAPKLYLSNTGIDLVYPKDPLAGGTWIATSNTGKTICLLNGAFETHKHLPPYRISRGLLVLEMLSNPNSEQWIHQFSLEGIEPFTIIYFDEINERLIEYRWDEEKLHEKILDNQQSYIWASSTLYNASIRTMRQETFDEWLINAIINSENIFNFHKYSGNGDLKNNFVMKREGVETISITQVIIGRTEKRMVYEDLIDQKQYQTSMHSCILKSDIPS